MLTYLSSIRLMAIIALFCGFPLYGGSMAAGGGGACFESAPDMIGVLEEELSVPNCGPFTIGIVMKFRMLDKKTNAFYYIGVVILCPNIYGKKFFSAGNKYRITCKGKVAGDIKRYNEYIIINRYDKLNLPTYVAEKVVLLQ